MVQKGNAEGPRRLTLEEAMNLPVTLSVWPELGKLTGMSRNACYRAVDRGDVQSVKIGGRKFVLTAPLLRKLGVYSAPTNAPPELHIHGQPQGPGNVLA
jgi:predicted DNA-binding transcriptional regulator AlpA